MRGSAKSAAANVAPAAISDAASSEVVRPTTASPAAAAERTPVGEVLEGDRALGGRVGELEAAQIGQRIGLGPFEFRADDGDRQPGDEAERAEHGVDVGAGRVGHHGDAHAQPFGEVEKLDRSGNPLDAGEVGAVGGLLRLQRGALGLGRKMRKKHSSDQFVRRAVDARVVGLLIDRDPVGSENPLEGREVFRVAVDQRPVEVEEERRALRLHIVAPICQGMNSASP